MFRLPACQVVSLLQEDSLRDITLLCAGKYLFISLIKKQGVYNV